MSKTSSVNSANRLTTNCEKIPCVQYGFANGPARDSKLQTIFDPVPEDAVTASPVYLLTREQYDRQQQRKNPYQVGSGYTMIATKLQDECEADDRVLYPVHIESDEYHEEEPDTLIAWFHEFVEDYLNVSFHSCMLYFSGGRSIHVHVPRFVSSETERKQLKELAEAFCEETEAGLDCGLYSSKRMFRIPGVKHETHGLSKVEIEPEWDKTRIFREAHTASPDVPESYVTVLRDVFLQESLTVDSAQPKPYSAHDPFHILDSDGMRLKLPSCEQEIETPLIEQTRYPDNRSDVPKWAQYNAKEFSPYALASGNGRSVAVVKVKGGAFARKETRNGATLIPAYFYGARGCAGEEFTKYDEHAPLQLSVPDYDKWDYEDGDHVVIVGGQSRNSRIFRVKSWHATVAGHALSGDNGSREAALDYLESIGYDVGEGGTSGAASNSNTAGAPRRRGPIRPVQTPRTEAAKLQQQAEQSGIRTLTHMERWRVACRLLWHGWEPAWEWFKTQFGTGFKPDVTWEQLRSVVQAIPDDYGHVEVPPKPR